MPHSTQDFCSVLLQLLSFRAPVAALPAPQVPRDIVFGQRQSRRNALQQCDERLAVGLAGGEEAQLRHRLKGGAGVPASSASEGLGASTSIGSGWPRSSIR